MVLSDDSLVVEGFSDLIVLAATIFIFSEAGGVLNLEVDLAGSFILTDLGTLLEVES